MDLEIVPEIPRSGNNVLLPYADIVAELREKEPGTIAVFRDYDNKQADKIVRSFKKYDDVVVHTRAGKESGDRDVYVKLGGFTSAPVPTKPKAPAAK